MKTPEVGQKLYALNIGNNSRFRKQELTEVEVVSVGRKYFKCRHGDSFVAVEYRLENGLEHSEYAPGFKIYESPLEWENDRDRERIIKVMREVFSLGMVKLSLEQLRAMEAIVQNHKCAEVKS